VRFIADCDALVKRDFAATMRWQQRIHAFLLALLASFS
jgi:hypothetical protein